MKMLAPAIFHTDISRFHPPKVDQVEIPSANGYSNARSLGLMAAAMVSDAEELAKQQSHELPKGGHAEETGRGAIEGTREVTEEKVVSFQEEQLLREITESAQVWSMFLCSSPTAALTCTHSCSLPSVPTSLCPFLICMCPPAAGDAGACKPLGRGDQSQDKLYTGENG
jgi:hypothetical protein